jgi:hypothetical protein
VFGFVLYVCRESRCPVVKGEMLFRQGHDRIHRGKNHRNKASVRGKNDGRKGRKERKGGRVGGGETELGQGRRSRSGCSTSKRSRGTPFEKRISRHAY